MEETPLYSYNNYW